MKKIKKYVFLLSLSVAVFAMGTSRVTSQIKMNDKKNVKQQLGLMVFNEAQSYSLKNSSQLFKEVFNPSSQTSFKLLKQEQDPLGFTHKKMQQYFNGIKVEFATVTLNSKSGSIESVNSDYFPIAEDFDTNPTLSKSQAFNSALSHVGASKYLWQNAAEAALVNNYKKPTGELVIFPAIKNVSATNRLAYKFDIYAISPLYRAYVYIDAKTGQFIMENKRIHDANVPATGTSLYNGNVSFTADNSAGPYRLRQTADGDGGGIQTFDLNNSTNYGSAVDITSNSTNFTSNPKGVQAHFGAEKTYMFYFQKFGRNSYNNAGGEIKSYVSYSNNYVNAFWDGTRMTYGDGDGSQYGPLVSLDICGHEITHGVTEYSANLAYQGESGALNESFSDIFGESIEKFASGSNDWLMGDDIGVGGSGGAFRSFSNPNSFNQPDTYLGSYWYTGSGDSGGVHTNSGVQNFWFYILSVGKSGTNDNGDSYAVTGIGMDKAAAIAYRNLTVYLTANSQYSDARAGAIQSAIDLYGACSLETQAVTNAWHAVGVGDAFVNTCTPSIGFLNVTGNTLEATDCGYQDINIPLIIGLGPSQNATVTFSVAGGTATNNVDFEIITPTVNFPSGSRVQQNMTLRVYNDGFVEADETAIINFTVNANGGDAVADTTANTFTFTINNDDVAPTNTIDSVVLSEDFADWAGWQTKDKDDDGKKWLSSSLASGGSITGFDGDSAASETNLSILGGSGKASANNYLISPKVTIPDSTSNVAFKFSVDGYNTIEHYKIYWTTDISTYASINGGIVLEERNATKDVGDIRTINNTSISNQTGYFVIRHFNSSSNNGILLFDNLTITATFSKQVQTAVNTGSTDDEISLTGTGTIYTSDATTGKVMMDITNNNSFDYGCTDTSVSRAGTGAQAYNSSTLPNFVMDKNFQISVDNTTSSGDTKVKFYFTPDEINGWMAATGLQMADLAIGRDNGGTLIETSTTPIVIGSFGTKITLTGTFTGLDGTFLFGPMGAFASCSGVTKTWDGTNWSPSGAPDTTNPVIINGNYNTTTNGNLNACTLVVNANKTLTVGATNFVKVNSNIDVNGTLFINNEGSLVQIDDDATVTNNGSITVRKVTPFLAPRYFMVLGSPMTAETRSGVYGNSVLVRNHTTENFVPNPDVAAGDPSAENFADDNGDDWQNYSGIINAGEGYLVLPQPDLASSGSYTLDYTLGTLSNGEVDYNVAYNGTQNASPNIVGNPYASAIEADSFMAENSMVDAVYFWEHLTTASHSYPGYKYNNYDMGDISMYNSSGGVAAANDSGNTTEPNGYIASGQGFGFKASAAGTAKFKNYMRVTDNNDTYRKPTGTKERIWLQVNNKAYGLSSTALISFSEASMDGYDSKYDAKRLATPVSIYSKLETGEELAIQGRSAFNVDQEVPLGFVSQVEENQEFNISISKEDGTVWSDVQVYLVDKEENIVHNLTNSDYTFKSREGAQNDRFVLLFKNTILDTPENQLQNITIVPNPTTGVLSILSPKTIINTVAVYDIRGRKLMDVDFNGNQNILDLSGLQAATYFVKIKTQEGTLTKRVIKQ